ncbi:hypothetical protein CCHR01_01330 [Colletotrichum chrysophilum]|uniref:Uncharacterized protein n=1 Tax=Colletotrichum chrysophilum TaxID=1836956 RepID=A0AAD9EPK6_9PEZI|nr:hypothetical protein CCHR01_01330 [Colletotrichum chrysophilum]
MTGGRVLDDVDCGAGPELLVEVLRGLKVLVELGLLLEPADTEVAVVDMVPDCRVVDPEEADCDADPELPPVEIDTGMLEVLLVPEAKLDVPDVLEVLLPVEENPAKLVELLENDVEDDARGEVPDVNVENEDVNEDEDKAGDEDANENIDDDVDEIEEEIDKDNDEDDEDADDKDDDEEDDDEDNNEDDDDEVRRDEVELVGDGQDAAGGGFPYIVKYGLAPVLPHGEVGAPEQGKGQLLSAAAELLHGA